MDSPLPTSYTSNTTTCPAEPVDDHNSPRPSRWRLKSGKRPRRNDNTAYDDHDSTSHRRPNPYHTSSSHYHHHHHRSHHRSKRQKPSHTPTPPDHPSCSRPSCSLDPDTAFRESLFDALADDEGAQFWESVYGQPIHTYASTRSVPGADGDLKLEEMTDEEYARYVRARMWEKTRGFVEEERALREEERRRVAKEREKEEGDGRQRKREGWGGRGGVDFDFDFQLGVEEALRRGEERRKAKRLSGRWTAYISGWENLNNLTRTTTTPASVPTSTSTNPTSPFPLKQTLIWPVESLSYTDVSKEHVEHFLSHAPLADNDNAAIDLASVLKVERVRWHPDKIQQRFGNVGSGLDKGVMRKVTAVWQVIDRLWGKVRDGKEKRKTRYSFGG